MSQGKLCLYEKMRCLRGCRIVRDGTSPCRRKRRVGQSRSIFHLDRLSYIVYAKVYFISKLSSAPLIMSPFHSPTHPYHACRGQPDHVCSTKLTPNETTVHSVVPRQSGWLLSSKVPVDGHDSLGRIKYTQRIVFSMRGQNLVNAIKSFP